MKVLFTMIFTLIFSINAMAEDKEAKRALKAAEELQLANTAKSEGHHLKAVNHYKFACDNGSIEGCYNLAVMHKEGKVFALKKTYSYKLYATTKKYREDSPNPNYDHITALYGLSCDVGIVPACVDLANIYAKGTHVPKDEIKAADLYGVACLDGVKRGCVNAGNLYSNNNQKENAAKMWAIACNKYDEGKSCKHLEKLYIELCDGGDNESCYNLGNMYRSGATAVNADIQKALKLFKNACDNDYESACNRLNSLSAKGY